MLKNTRLAGALVLALVATGCTNPAPITTPSTGSLTPAAICADIAAINAAPTAANLLNSLDPTSVTGQGWVDLKAGCPNGVPAAGVDASWIVQIGTWARPLLGAALRAVIPYIPTLIGLL